MKLAPREKSPHGEPIVPLINVVFLLLIFLMLSSESGPADPFTIDPARSSSETETSHEPNILYVSRDLEIAYGTARGEDDAFSAIAAAYGAGVEGPLEVKADGEASMVKILALVKRVMTQGVRSVVLVTQRRR